MLKNGGAMHVAVERVTAVASVILAAAVNIKISLICIFFILYEPLTFNIYCNIWIVTHIEN